MNSILSARSHQVALATSGLQPAAMPSRPVLVLALVILVALMSTYVNVLNNQVERAERLRDSFGRSATRAPAMKARAQNQKMQQMAESSPSLSPVSLDTAR